MKKIFLLISIMLIVLTGCGKFSKEDAIKKFQKDVEHSKSYKIVGTMQINNGEENYNYSLEVNYLKDNYYKVIMVNQTNNHEQIILKNNDGLYVVTPKLNKSFKFDSMWPDNSSQAYLLNNLLNDILNDKMTTYTKKQNDYTLECKVSYLNNEDLVKEKMIFDRNMQLKKVIVYDKDSIEKIVVNFKDINLKAKLNKENFKLEDLVTDDNSECNENNCNDEVSKLDSIIYPLYIPKNTHLANSEELETENGTRVILTFSGEKNFVLVEESSKKSNEFEIVPVFGEPAMLNESIGAISSNSMSWNANNVSYYLVGNDLSTSEMVNIASSLGNTKTVISTK